VETNLLRRVRWSQAQAGAGQSDRRIDLSRPAIDVANAIDQFERKNGDWIELDDLLQELFRSECPTLGIDALLRVFERFPTEDGAEVFWGIVHGLESLPGYDECLVQSIRSSPSEFGLIMLHRLLNSGGGQRTTRS
jgi:hypothetical protein